MLAWLYCFMLDRVHGFSFVIILRHSGKKKSVFLRRERAQIAKVPMLAPILHGRVYSLAHIRYVTVGTQNDALYAPVIIMVHVFIVQSHMIITSDTICFLRNSKVSIFRRSLARVY